MNEEERGGKGLKMVGREEGKEKEFRKEEEKIKTKKR
jgi:hypothetical protein